MAVWSCSMAPVESLACSRHSAMRYERRVELIESEETAAGFLGLIEPAVVREQDCSQEHRIGVLMESRGTRR